MANIFQKRDLSDQSQGGNERKKSSLEGSLGSSNDDTDVFSEGLESADCKPFLQLPGKFRNQSEQSFWSG